MATDRPVVLVPLATARRAARRAGVTLNLSTEDIQLAGKWKHGWIPLDAAAAAVKAKRYHGGGGEGRTVKGKGRAGSAVESRRESSRGRTKVAPSLEQSRKVSVPAEKPARVRSMEPDGRFSGVHSESHRGNKISVRRHPRKEGYLQSSINGHPVGSPVGGRNKDAVRELDSLRGVVNNAHERPEAYTNGDGEVSYGMKLSGATAGAGPRREPATARAATSGLDGKSAGSMTAAERAKAAEVMHGTGSKQHRKALATVRAQQVAQERTRRAGRGEPKLADLSEADLQGLIGRYGEKSVQADAARAEMLRRAAVRVAEVGTSRARLVDLRRLEAGGNKEARRELDRRAGRRSGRKLKAVADPARGAK